MYGPKCENWKDVSNESGRSYRESLNGSDHFWTLTTTLAQMIIYFHPRWPSMVNDHPLWPFNFRATVCYHFRVKFESFLSQLFSLDRNDFIWGSLSDDLFKTWPNSKSFPRPIEGHYLNFCWNPFQFSKLSFDSSEIGIFFDKIEATAFCPASLIKRQNARISIPTETLSTIQNAVFLMSVYDKKITEFSDFWSKIALFQKSG